MNVLVIGGIVAGIAWLLSQKNTQATQVIMTGPTQAATPATNGTTASNGTTATTAPSAGGVGGGTNAYWQQWGDYPPINSDGSVGTPPVPPTVAALVPQPAKIATEGTGPAGGCAGCKKNCQSCNGVQPGTFPDGSGACIQPDQQSLINWLSQNFPTASDNQLAAMQGCAFKGASGMNSLAAPSAAQFAARDGVPLSTIISNMGPTATNLDATDLFNGIIGAGYSSASPTLAALQNQGDSNVLTLADVAMMGANAVDGMSAVIGL